MRQLSKQEWLYQTSEGEEYRIAEDKAWMAQHDVTGGFSVESWGENNKPSHPKSVKDVVKIALRVWGALEGAGKKRPENYDELLVEAVRLTKAYEAVGNYADYVRRYKDGRGDLEPAHNTLRYGWAIDNYQIGETSAYYILEWCGERFDIPKALPSH